MRLAVVNGVLAALIWAGQPVVSKWGILNAFLEHLE